MGVVDTYEDFYASHNHMPGSSRTLRVTGTVMFVTGGCSCELGETEGNTGPTPQMLSLDLRLGEPADGTVVPQIVTPCSVEFTIDNPEIDYQQVEFNVVGTDDKPPPVLDIVHPE